MVLKGSDEPFSELVFAYDAVGRMSGVTQVRSDRVSGVNTVSVDGFRQRNNQTTALAPLVTNTCNANSQVTTEAFPSSQSPARPACLYLVAKRFVTACRCSIKSSISQA